jgi:hypothetical protein
MSNTTKKKQPHWLRHPKTKQEKKEAGNAKDQGVKVRGKRSAKNLPDLYDDKPVDSNLKKQNKAKKPAKDTIRKESTDIVNFIEAIMLKNYASANKYIKQAVESRLQEKIEQELQTPLF